AASPMKTFENLASGELREGDTIILTTPGVTDLISPASLRNILESNEPSEAVKTLQARVGHDSTGANASVVFRFSRLHAVAPVATPATHTHSPQIKSYIAASAPAAVPAERTSQTKSTKSSKVKASLSKLKAIKFKSLSRIFKKKSQSVPQTMASHKSSPVAKTKLRVRLKRAVIRMPARAKLFTVLALVLALVFAVSLFIFVGARGSKAARTELTAKLEQAKKLEEEAAAAIIFKDTTQAQDLLKRSEVLLTELAGNKDFEQEAATLKSNIARDYEKLSGSTRIDEPTKLASLGGNPLGLAVLEGELVAWLENSKFEVVSLKDGDTATSATLDKDLGAPILGAVDETRLVVATDEAKLVGFENGDLSELEVGGTFQPEQLASLKTYGNRLYVLDPASNKINRFARTLAGYGQGTSWILDGTSVSEGVDLAIDGNIYLLTRSTGVIKFLQGTKEDFTLGPVVDPLEQPTKIVTSEDMGYLYILEPKKRRLLQFDKEKGDFVKQFVSEAFNDLKDVVVIEKGARAYLLNGDSIYQIELNK
ncbi:MAG: hypothetical protein V1895_03835, partial [Parcubacteria group bacterium]